MTWRVKNELSVLMALVFGVGAWLTGDLFSLVLGGLMIIVFRKLVSL
jgi:hypothetical protein